MAAEVARPIEGRNIATDTLEIDFALILSRVIDSANQNPAELRRMVYEAARLRLEEEGRNRIPPVEDGEMQRLTNALHTAIERVEVFSSKQEELRALRSLDRLIGNLEPDVSNRPALDPVRVIGHSSMASANAATANIWTSRAGGDLALAPTGLARRATSRLAHFMDRFFSNGLLLDRLHLNRFGSTPMVRGAVVALLALGFLYPVLSVGSGVLRSPSKLPESTKAISIRDADGRKLASSTPAPDAGGQRSARSHLAAEEAVERSSLASAAARNRDFPLPTAYGIYAISNGELIELDALPGRAPDPRILVSAIMNKPSRTILPDGRVRFLAFRRDLATVAPERVSVRVIAAVTRALAFDPGGKASVAKVEGSWAIRNVAFNLRVTPLREQPEMLLVQSDVPDFALPAGRYGVVLKDVVYDFTVAGTIADAAQCLERTVATNGTFYSECRKL
jgi:hypothetical protein